MKKIISTALLLFFTANLFAQLRESKNGYTIPDAAQQPAWVFPIYLLNGDGQRDTVYYAYDSQADDWANDTIFGEKWQKMPDTAFFAYWEQCCFGQIDTISVVRNMIIKSFRDVVLQVNNAVLPVIIFWDVSLLRSDSLPFPDQSPAPRAQGEFWVGDNVMGCGFQTPVVLTDTAVQGLSCSRKDSVFIEDVPPITGAGGGQFNIVPWTGFNNGGLSIKEESTVKSNFYPNPFTERATLNIQTNRQKLTLNVFDALGKKANIPYTVSKAKERTNIEISRKKIPEGVYFYQLLGDNKIITTGKFIIN